MFVTADCTDPDYHDAVVDSEQDLTEPIRHRKVAGHFAGTDKRFAIYLPPADRWQGRFFQYVYPLLGEDADARSIEFAAASGGYLVQTNGGAGYRVDAAAAKFAKTVAAQYYERDRRIFGYSWGGSGGSYQVIAGMENTTGVWDGGVPFIVGDPSSIPNNFFTRAYARILLGDRAGDIGVAVSPGSLTDPYDGLDPVERDVLREVSALGIPLRAWEDFRYLLGMDSPDGLFGFATHVKAADPTYVADFWTKPGYLGTQRTPLGDRVRAAVVDLRSTVVGVDRVDDQVVLTLNGADGLRGDTPLDLTVTNLPTVAVTVAGAKQVKLAAADYDRLGTPGVGSDVSLDNRWYIALSAYARHQVPSRSGFDVYDQYRNPDGTPTYPQRPILAGPQISELVSGGATHTGRIHGKVIAVANVLDVDAFPWHADWYRRQVEGALGNEAADMFRLWYNDNADHIAPPRTERMIDYTGMLEQALRDISAWAESDDSPAPNQSYRVTNGQVLLPAPGAEIRGGIQPVVTLTANGQERAEVRIGRPVELVGSIALTVGDVVRAEWSPTGKGFDETAAPPDDSPVQLTSTVTYDRPGVYFPALRVTAGRRDSPTPFAQVQNIARVRVVVSG